jgi:predicted phosphodiesterase
MRVAVLGDIHGNLPALRAVLADVDAAGVEAIVILGDTAGGPLVERCLELISGRPEPVRWVAGNGERESLACWNRPAGEHDQMARWSAEHLSREWRDRMAQWPLALEFDGAYFCHASPRADDENLTLATPGAVLLDVFDGIAASLIVGAHTHQQFVRELADGRTFANCGSVGIPYEGRSGAFWMLVTDGRPELRATAYDISAAVAELGASGFPTVDEVFGGSLIGDPVDPAWVTAYFEHLAGRGEPPGEP